MTDFKDSRLWQHSFSARAAASASEKRAAETLKHAYLEMRERAKVLVSQIPKDLCQFTVHDITHLDSLWELASLISGREINLNPLEAFVFGAAVLIHDAGMSLAAYPGGIDDLKKNRRWKDSVFMALKQKLGQPPAPKQLREADRATEQLAIEHLLRELHAEQAQKLAIAKWQAIGSNPYYLIDNPDMRSSLGTVIGNVAFSHWWPVSRLQDEFPKRLGAPLDFPTGWQIDARKLACLLRLADAAHLDWRRAPGFLRVLLRPTDTAADHWTFQERLNQALLEEDRLVFTSARPFQRSDARAWWLCLRVVRVLDAELRAVDDLLADNGERRFAAKTVKGVEDPERFAQFVRTEAWMPVEAKIQVTDVAALVSRLGGEELYGDDLTVPVRELIQNAADAIRARRFLGGRGFDGSITIRLKDESDGEWLEVEDNGIGMSKEVVTGPFLDFGKSYWGSALMMAEYPGLASSGFESTGKYGIGFFSSFMLGDRVTVITRPFFQATAGTAVLEFYEGTKEQPLLRKAEPTEELPSAGTIIRVRLATLSVEKGGLLGSSSKWGSSLAHLITRLCPALDVNIAIIRKDNKIEQLRANDWLTIDASALLRRVGGPYDGADKALNLKIIRNSDSRVVGRAGIVPYDYPLFWASQSGVVAVGGLRSTQLVGIAGVLNGFSKRAARDKAEILVEKDSLAQWANDQIEIVKSTFAKPEDQASCAVSIELCGGSARTLPIVTYRGKWLSCEEIAGMNSWPLRVLLVHDYDFRKAVEDYGEFDRADNVLLTPTDSTVHTIYAPTGDFGLLYEPDNRRRHPVSELLAFALARSWGIKLQDVRVWSTSYVKIGEYLGNEVRTSATVFLHPSVPEDEDF